MFELIFNAIALFFNSTWGFAAFAVVSFVLVFSLTKNQKVFVASLVIAALLGVGLKAFYGIDRPCVESGSLIPCPLSSGFPSTHAVVAIVIALGALGTFLFWPLLILSIAVSLSRVWLGVHTIDQVAGGMALGVMVFLAIYELNQRLYGGEYRIDLDEMLNENLLNKKVWP